MKKLLALLLLSCCAVAWGATPGEALFKKHCAVCHGPDGKANSPQARQLGAANLTASDIQNMADSGLAGIIRNGRGVMPPFSKTLAPEQVKEVVKYIRTLGK